MEAMKKCPTLLRMSKADLDLLIKERPEVAVEGQIWGMKIELTSEGLTGYLTVWS